MLSLLLFSGDQCGGMAEGALIAKWVASSSTKALEREPCSQCDCV